MKLLLLVFGVILYRRTAADSVIAAPKPETGDVAEQVLTAEPLKLIKQLQDEAINTAVNVKRRPDVQILPMPIAVGEPSPQKPVDFSLDGYFYEGAKKIASYRINFRGVHFKDDKKTTPGPIDVQTTTTTLQPLITTQRDVDPSVNGGTTEARKPENGATTEAQKPENGATTEAKKPENGMTTDDDAKLHTERADVGWNGGETRTTTKAAEKETEGNTVKEGPVASSQPPTVCDLESRTQPASEKKTTVKAKVTDGNPEPTEPVPTVTDGSQKSTEKGETTVNARTTGAPTPADVDGDDNEATKPRRRKTTKADATPVSTSPIPTPHDGKPSKVSKTTKGGAPDPTDPVPAVTDDSQKSTEKGETTVNARTTGAPTPADVDGDDNEATKPRRRKTTKADDGPVSTEPDYTPATIAKDGEQGSKTTKGAAPVSSTAAPIAPNGGSSTGAPVAPEAKASTAAPASNDDASSTAAPPNGGSTAAPKPAASTEAPKPNSDVAYTGVPPKPEIWKDKEGKCTVALTFSFDAKAGRCLANKTYVCKEEDWAGVLKQTFGECMKTAPRVTPADNNERTPCGLEKLYAKVPGEPSAYLYGKRCKDEFCPKEATCVQEQTAAHCCILARWDHYGK